jgi:hypothetical protein
MGDPHTFTFFATRKTWLSTKGSPRSEITDAQFDEEAIDHVDYQTFAVK